MYLHENAEPEISFTKDDMHLGKHTEYERRLIESMNSRAPPPQSSLASQLDKILAPAYDRLMRKKKEKLEIYFQGKFITDQTASHGKFQCCCRR